MTGTTQDGIAGAARPSFAEMFTPKLVTILREGYSAQNFKADAIAGLTVAIVALPLSMAIAIASGTTPDRGLYTAVIGGFLISALGGSRFQIGGPAGAFIILVAATVSRHGIDGLLLATLMAGVLLMALGFLRLGSYIKFIPYPVTVGFTAGIAVIIFASQIKEILGLSLAGPEPGEIVAKVKALVVARDTFTPAAFGIALLVIAIIAGLKRYRPHWPGMLIAVATAGIAGWAFNLPVDTIGARFGGIPQTLPLPSLPHFTPELAMAVLPDAFAFALLGAIESLLSAVVADGMTGRRHRSNCELVAQGIANIGSALFGGICATGTIARTATNVRAGAHGPIAGILHALFLLVFILVAAPLADFIPLAALAGVLAVVAWNMAERHAFGTLLRSSRGDAVVVLATFLLTVFRDLTEGILVGFALGSLLFLHRMAQSISVESHAPVIAEDRADNANGDRASYDAALSSDPDLVIYRITGAFFFGAASTVGAVLDRIADRPQTFILDFASVPFLDSTAANTIEGNARKAHRKGVTFIVTGAAPAVRHTLWAHGVKPPLVRFEKSIEDALTAIGRPLEEKPAA
ncbi:SulP family sulfate permease [Dongia mobilis]|uniref:SulP family sulfate permease n=1 Tax=Dongia mobilis TaxID=578943 RepID=A0A4R6WS54_9PROT|nr:SulP family inorganic anion transporter [Dongia mobilis]TDQ84435.1 SulP family sulfate permease [Dongia mobilis]